jgi:hypothetical protein
MPRLDLIYRSLHAETHTKRMQDALPMKPAPRFWLARHLLTRAWAFNSLPVLKPCSIVCTTLIASRRRQHLKAASHKRRHLCNMRCHWQSPSK